MPTASAPLLSEERCRHLLIRTWHAFFARFAHLKPIQRASIGPILHGDSVIINAPTAAGKTEAIMAPAIERYFATRAMSPAFQPPPPSLSPDGSWLTAMARAKSANFYSGTTRIQEKKADFSNSSAALKGPAILLIAPTKALCNDLFRRLRTPVSATGLDICVKTGDTPNFHSEKPPHILITTPESLDSLIARAPASFKTLHALVVDEIHLVATSGRGDQLQCLIARLKILNPNGFQICASSATAPEISKIADDFIGPKAKIITSTETSRRIDAQIRMIREDPQQAIADTADIIAQMLDESPTRKLLIFCNSRANVESIVYTLKTGANHAIASRVFAHHGSLSKEERLRTEQQFLRAKNAACVATSTLELGIDIGDVDRILLLGPSPDVSSLIQRIGRGCRSLDTVSTCGLADCPFNASRFAHLVECAKSERLFPDPVAIRPTVIVQQALSICLQNPKGWIAKQALHDRLAPSAQTLYSTDDCQEILLSMAEHGLLRKIERGKFVPEPKAQFLFERGYIHSMIADRGETDVVDAVTGRTLGSVYLKKSKRNDVALGNDVTLTLGGAAHTVSYIRDQKIFVHRGEESSSTGFLALEPPRYSLGLARDFSHFMNIPDDAIYIASVPANLESYRNFTPETGSELQWAMPAASFAGSTEFHVNHFLGTIGCLLLQHFFENHGAPVKKGSATPFFMRLTAKPAIDVFPDEQHLIMFFETDIAANPKLYAKRLQPGPWFQIIPENITQRWLMRSIDTRAYAKFLANKRITIL